MEQLIMYPRDQSFWPHENQSDLFELGFYGPALRKAFLQEVLSYYFLHNKSISALETSL